MPFLPVDVVLHELARLPIMPAELGVAAVVVSQFVSEHEPHQVETTGTVKTRRQTGAGASGLHRYLRTMVLSSDSPRPPITLCGDDTLDVFADVASAVHDMDLDDVRNGRVAFDSLGTPLRIVDNGDWLTDLVIAPNVEPVPDELALQLRTSIASLGPDWVGLPEFESAPLDTLLDALLRFQTGTHP